VKNTGTIISIVLILVVLVVLLGGTGMMGFGSFSMGPSMMGGFGMQGYGGQFGLGFNALGAMLSLVIWTLIIGGLALLGVWFLRNAGWTAFTTSTSASPVDIAKARYARGEITKEQYEELRRELAP
jgi:putative membrane protein